MNDISPSDGKRHPSKYLEDRNKMRTWEEIESRQTLATTPYKGKIKEKLTIILSIILTVIFVLPLLLLNLLILYLSFGHIDLLESLEDFIRSGIQGWHILKHKKKKVNNEF